MFGSFLPSLWSLSNHSLLGFEEPTLLCNHVGADTPILAKTNRAFFSEVISAGAELMRLRDGIAVGVRQRDAVQIHLRIVSPRFFEMPKFDTFQDTFAGEFDVVVTSS